MARKVFFSFLAVAVILTFPALAAERSGALGPMTVSAAAVEWQANAPRVEHLVLTVMTPSGAVITREFSGTRASFRPADLVPYNVTDGTYQFTLQGVPRVSTAVRAQLNDARERGDEAAIAQIQKDNGLTDPLVESGVFTIINGSIVTDAAEPAAKSGGKLGAATANSLPLKPKANDQVVADDEIVQGSLCVGLDCVVNESFGFDTIRLKENNTRIKFQDTSTGTGFPNVNWQLTANDSNSGGANKFSIDDITNSKTPFTVIAAAPTNSLFIASTGKVGFGNNSPGLNLHITATDTPAIRQEQTSGGGFTAQTWDIGANEANWFVRDLTGGSRLPLRIRPGAPTSSIDISASGNVGVGTASPSYLLDLLQTFPAVRLNSSDATQGAAMRFSQSGTERAVIESLGSSFGTTTRQNNLEFINETATGAVTIFTNSAERVRVDSAGNIGIGVTAPTQPIQHSNGAFLSTGGAWTNASSRALKDDIADLSADAAKCALEELKPVTYVYKADRNEHHVGFIAEDVPDLVASKDRKGLSSLDIVAVLTKVVQEQQQTIDELKARLDQIEHKQ